MKNKEKYAENLKQIKNNTLDDLEPVIKKASNNFLDLVKEFCCDIVSYMFEKRKNKK
jgi:hypothetical protein